MDTLETAGGESLDAIDAVIDEMDASATAIETKAAGSRRPGGADNLTQAVVAIGHEVLQQGRMIQRLAAQPSGTPATMRDAHGTKMRAWNTYQDLLKRKGQHARDPLTRAHLARLDTVLDRMGDLEKRMRLAEVKRDRPPGLSSRYPGAGRPNAKRSGLAAYLNSPHVALYRKALDPFLRWGQEMFNGHHINDLARRAVKEMHTEGGPAGGYFMFPERDNSPLATFMTELSPMRERAEVRSITTDEFEQPVVLSNATANWVGEREVRQETDSPELGIDRRHTFMLEAEPKITTKLLDDAGLDLEAWLVEQIGTAFAERESPAWFTGTGVNQPRGLLTYDFVTDHSTWQHGKFRLVETGVSGAFPATNPTGSPPTMPDNVLIDVQTALKAGHRKNATWLMSRSTVGVIRKMRDVDGRPLWQPAAQAGQPASLLGHAIDEDEFMPDIGMDTVAIGFGDWKRTYQILDRIGVRVLRNPYKNHGWVHFYTTKRVGGAVRYFDAAVFLRFSAAA